MLGNSLVKPRIKRASSAHSLSLRHFSLELGEKHVSLAIKKGFYSVKEHLQKKIILSPEYMLSFLFNR